MGHPIPCMSSMRNTVSRSVALQPYFSPAWNFYRQHSRQRGLPALQTAFHANVVDGGRGAALTTSVMNSADHDRVGTASGIINAVAPCCRCARSCSLRNCEGRNHLHCPAIVTSASDALVEEINAAGATRTSLYNRRDPKRVVPADGKFILGDLLPTPIEYST